MKNFFVLSFAIFSCGTLGASDLDKDFQRKINIHIVNKDIGPVQNGDFFLDQKYAFEHLKGQAPDIGQFKIPNGGECKDFYSLENMIPKFSFSFQNAGIQEFIGEPLKLPGSKNYQIISWNKGDYNLENMRIFPYLITKKYKFTSPLDELHKPIVEENLIKGKLELRPELNNNITDITIEYSWPVTVKTTNYRPVYIDVNAYNGTPDFGGGEEVKLEKDWESKIRLKTFIREEYYKPHSYTSRDLNCFNLTNEDFIYVVKNSLKDFPWLNVPKGFYKGKLVSSL